MRRLLAALDLPLQPNRRWWLPVIAAVFVLSSLITGPLPEEAAAEGWFRQVGPIFVGRPVVTSGDSPHYLTLVNSLIEDRDFDLSNNFRQSEAGDWDAGTRWRGQSIDRHVDVDRQGRELLTHSPFMPMLLAALVWPLRGTQWVESACIWITMLAVLCALWLLPRIEPRTSVAWPLLLAFCTPLWCYARDVWTETWLVVAWLVLLAVSSPWLIAAAAAVGILFKYSFAVVPATMALVALWRRDFARFAGLAGGTALGLIAAIGFIQYLFQDTDHFSLFHSGTHVTARYGVLLVGPFGVSSKALPGLLLDPEDGLLLFAPFLAWGLWRTLRGGGYVFLPALAFFVLHCTYLGWRAGTGFSARYLIPMLPVLALAAISGSRRPRSLFWLAAAWSLLICGLAGMLPAAAFDRSPLQLLGFLGSKGVEFLTGGGP